jgi:uracil-DNA glycosylase
MSDLRQLLGEIAHCSIAKAIRLGDSPVSVPCHNVVSLQAGKSFQLPEPWSGQLDTAPLLFVSSNPAIDELEVYPDESWEDGKTIDFFQKRFTSEDGWVIDGRALQQRGTRGRGVSFWGHARNRAREILQREVTPGVDFALTEVVHCKSLKERGVSEALDFCSERYLEKVIASAAAKVLVVYGKHAADAIRGRFGSAMIPQGPGLSLIFIRDTPRMLVFLPHPNRPGPKKTLEARVGDDGLKLIRAHMMK